MYGFIKIFESFYLYISILEQRGSVDIAIFSYVHLVEHIEHTGSSTHSKNSYLNQCNSSTKNKSLGLNSVSSCEEAASIVFFNFKDLRIQISLS